MNKIIESLQTDHIRAIADVVDLLLRSEARTATKYMSEKLTIRASLKLYGKKMPRSNSRSLDIVLTIGAPNFEGREFIKKCKEAGVKFPVKKIQLKFISKKDKK